MAITSLTVCEYLHTAYEPDAEYVDGEIEERAAGEYDHATWQYALLRWFTAHEEEWDLPGALGAASAGKPDALSCSGSDRDRSAAARGAGHHPGAACRI